MRAALTVIALGSALLFSRGSAQALGFGQASNGTQLGQALNFAAAVHLEADEKLARECVSAEVFSGDNKLAPGQVRVHALARMQQGLDATVADNTAARRGVNAGQQSEQRCLAGAVAADQPHAFPVGDGKREIVQSLHEELSAVRSAQPTADTGASQHGFFQAARAGVVQREPQADVFGPEPRGAHSQNASRARM